MPLKGPTGVVFSRLKIVFRYDLTPISRGSTTR